MDPEYFDKYQKYQKKKKDEAEQQEQSRALIEQSHVQVAWAEGEITVDDDEYHVVFSG